MREALSTASVLNEFNVISSAACVNASVSRCWYGYSLSFWDRKLWSSRFGV